MPEVGPCFRGNGLQTHVPPGEDLDHPQTRLAVGHADPHVGMAGVQDVPAVLVVRRFLADEAFVTCGHLGLHGVEVHLETGAVEAGDVLGGVIRDPALRIPHVGLPAGPVPVAGVTLPKHLPAMLVGQQGEGFGVHHRGRRGLFPVLVDELHHHQPQLPDRFLRQLPGRRGLVPQQNRQQ